MKYFSQHFSLRWCQCGEKIVFCLVVIRLGETITLDPPGLHRGAGKAFVYRQRPGGGPTRCTMQKAAGIDSKDEGIPPKNITLSGQKNR